MKINLLLTGGTGLAIGAAMWMVAPSASNADESTSEYTPRQKRVAKSAHGQFEIMRDLKKNVHTGQIEKQDYLNAKMAVEMMMQNRTTSLQWLERGPDNIGGRTRAILIDKDNPLKVFAGSVTGGLFQSFDGGNSWAKVSSFTENLSISSMAQTLSGVLYVATGHFEEGGSGNGGSGGFGNGIYRSADNGATWTQVSGTGSISYINEIVIDSRHPDRIWIATPNTPGVRVLENNTLLSAGAWGETGLPTSGFHALDISPDGLVLVGAAATTGRQTWVSQVENIINELPENVYISFDIDCLDPAYAPGTGTPVPGGLTTYETQRILRALKIENLVGADVVEVCPPFDHADITALAAVDTMFEMMCLMAK
jgi:hypothetical protein